MLRAAAVVGVLGAVLRTAWVAGVRGVVLGADWVADGLLCRSPRLPGYARNAREQENRPCGFAAR